MSDNIEFEVDSADAEWPETAVALQGEIDRLQAENTRLKEVIDRDRLMYEEHYVERLTAERDRLLAIVARLCHRYEWWEASAEDPHPAWECFEGSVCSECNGGDGTVRSEPMDPADAELIRRALDHVGGDR